MPDRQLTPAEFEAILALAKAKVTSLRECKRIRTRAALSITTAPLTPLTPRLLAAIAIVKAHRAARETVARRKDR